MKHCFAIAVLVCLCSLLHAQQFPAQGAGARLSYRIISSQNNTWGYDIYNNEKLFIHQLIIPAIPGNEGFATKDAAEKTAKKVIEKIKNGENPPSLTIDELNQMHVLPKNRPLK